MNTVKTATAASIATISLMTLPAAAQTGPQSTSGDPSGSLLTQQSRLQPPSSEDRGEPHNLRAVSMFAVAPPEPRVYRKHDLVQIVVRETSQTKRTQELDANKEYSIDGAVTAWPHFDLSDLLQLQLQAGRTSSLPRVALDFSKDFTGEGEYTRKDDMSDRLTAEVIEVLPNGNLVLEARTHIKTDDEESTMKLTGMCRPEDITPANTLLSNQIHDLKIERVNSGELKRSNEKGIIAKVLDFFFAF